ncbi:hypothetical protein DERP_003266 [Dermatophagoides pteronyssinus]|uniref:Uncharacterized protein n=1 Tax=Dermatophagoides pteronyssinus TaxID=6956 RepID=A0ABQ8JJ18_DERPT|nr:hypothetical protein DERP_003266 [Dermatophagoides pteronyssinus]
MAISTGNKTLYSDHRTINSFPFGYYMLGKKINVTDLESNHLLKIVFAILKLFIVVLKRKENKQKNTK